MGGGGWGHQGIFPKHILKQGVAKVKSCSKGGGGFEGVTTPASPEKFNRKHTHDIPPMHS